MNRVVIVLYVILLIAVGYWCSSVSIDLKSDYKQAQSRVRYWNSKYIKDVTVFTGRRSRRDSYRTNMTATTLVPYGNNVSLSVSLEMKTGGDICIVSKLCETMNSKWMREFTLRYSNVTLHDGCPLPPGTYKYHNIELPPKNWPMPKMQGDYYVIMGVFVTASKESIMEISTLMHFDTTV